MVRYILAPLIILILVAVIGGGIFLASFDPNSYREELVAVVEEHTGRPMTISGELGLSFVPWLKITANGLALGEDPRFGTGDFVRLENVAASVRLLPLLFGEVELGKVNITGLSVHLIKDKNGLANWQTLVAREEKIEKKALDKTTEQAPASEQTSKDENRFTLLFGGLEVEDCTLTYEDRKTGAKYSIDKSYLRIDEFEPAMPFDFVFNTEIISTKPDLKANIDFSGGGTVDGKNMLFGITGAQLKVDVSGKDVPGTNESISLFSRNIQLALKEETLDLEGVKFTSSHLNGVLGMKVSGLLSNLAYSGSVKIEPADIRQILAKMESSYTPAGKNALKSVSFESDLSGTSESFAMKNIALGFDGAKMKGFVDVRSFSTPEIVSKLHADVIDLDKYLPEQPKEDAASAEGKDAIKADTQSKGEVAEKKSQKIELPMKLLRSIILDSKIVVDKFKVKNIKMSDVLVTTLGKGGVVQLNPFSADLYDGRVHVTAIGDFRKAIPTYTFTENLSAVEMKGLFLDMVDVKGFSGTFNSEVNVKTTGDSVSSLTKGLNGLFKFSLKDCRIPGIDLPLRIKKATDTKENKVIETKEDHSTAFALVRANGVIENGVVKNDDLYASSPLLRVIGSGVVHVHQREIDYKLWAKLVPEVRGSSDLTYDEISGVAFPLSIKGPVAKPSVSLNMADYFLELLKSPVKGIKNVKEGVGGLIKSFGGVFK
ncbi:MAG: AsmA family protein [Desulfovibrio sp.]